ncbi:MAG: fused response regulator/phosphatase [Pseudomonadota bacterium]
MAPMNPDPSLPDKDAQPSGAAMAARAILVVDDSRLQRRILCAQLAKLGYRVLEAESADAALAICRETPPDIVISDWMMPGMTGPAFCRAFRKMHRQRYGYFVLLTSKSGREEIAQGFDAGADDFLTKPIQAEELRARLAAGERVLRMEEELVEKNGLLTTALAELRSLYDSLDNDLAEARKLQQSLVKERFRSFGDSRVALLLRPSGHVGGDLVGFFPAGPETLALFAIDVSGHGVASALLTARLSSYLMSDRAERNIALRETPDGGVEAVPPAEVVRRLNILSLDEIDTDNYFTMVLAQVCLRTGKVRLAQAGHPHPLIQRADGRIEAVGDGGLPVGLIEGAEFTEVSLTLNPGDRLLVVSDGITECEDASGEMLEEDGLHRIMTHNRAMGGQGFLEALTWDLSAYSGSADFGDDVSAILFEYEMAPRTQAEE